jgi:pyruvate kinase
VILARGDLAADYGSYQRLASPREEDRWLCEPEHLPAVWATQMLDHLASPGRPSRAKIAEAALGRCGDWVLPNKGRHILAAVIPRDDIRCRAATDHCQTNVLMRPLCSPRSEAATYVVVQSGV